MKDTTPAPEGWTEATDIEIDRVDLVNGAANGTRFLLAKSDGDAPAGIFTADEVRDLIKETDVQDDTEPVAKADLDVSEPLATDAESADGPVDQPGSPAWEAVDAATARKWAAILARAKNAVQLLADRERMEDSVGADDEAWCNAWDLDDASCAIDNAISLLAPYALGEEMDVEFGSDSPIEAVTKTAAAIDSDSLDIIEVLAPVAKAGRVLSAANETAIRTAVDSLQNVLASLPVAPAVEEVVVVKAAEPLVVEITAALPDYLAKMTEGAPALTALQVFETLSAGGRALAKAKGDPQLAVFDENGKLIGTVDPGDLSPIASSAAQAADAGAEVADDAPADEPADDAPADDAAAPAEAAPAAPDAAPDAATIPGTATVQAPPQQDPSQVTKAAVAEAFGDLFAPFAEQFGKYAELAKTVEQVQERVEKMASRPDTRNSPVLNGATGTAGPVSRDGSGGDEFAELTKAVDAATSDNERRAALAALSHAKIAARFAQPS